MYSDVATSDPGAVEKEVQAAYHAMFPQGDKNFVPQIFSWATDWFMGRYDGYQPVDAKYHDFEHTLQGTLCMARLLCARQKVDAKPAISQRQFELGMLAILLHDTGYLKKNGDNEGTGAKYTVIHVRRSADFAAELLGNKRFSDADIKSVQNMILCTGINAALDRIPFQSEEEKLVGFALGTADLLGQMAAEDYVEKLPVLYSEFAEAARYDGAKGTSVVLFSSAEDMMRKTPAFWEKYVLPRLERDFTALYRFLNHPYPSGPNFYLDRIEKNISALRRQFAETQPV